MIILYDYYRSSAAYRVRIALQLKQLAYEKREVHLVRDGGQQHHGAYTALNPQQLVPTLVDDDFTLTQSLAIIEYLDEVYPDPIKLMPKDTKLRAEVRALAQLVVCDIHPLNNLRVLQYLQQDLQQSDEVKQQWYQHWILLGLQAFEVMLMQIDAHAHYCFGQQPTLADVCLIPQLYNARRYHCRLDDFPVICRIEAHCLSQSAFIQAQPTASS